MEGFGIRSAAAGAEETRPAVPALLLVQHRVVRELRLNVAVERAVQHAAHAVAVAADKLVAGVNIAVGRYRNILVARAAAGQTLAQARAALQVHHEVEEVEPLAVRAAIHINLRQALVFLADFGQILLAQGVFALRVGHNRLNADLVKALIRQMKHVVAKILVKAGKRATDVIFLVAGIAAAVVVVVLLIKNFDKVKAVAQTVFGGIKTFITTLVDAFKSLGLQIKNAFWGAFNWVKKKIQPIIDWISDKIGKIRSGFEKIGNFFSNLGFGSSANTGSQYSLSANGGKATGTPYFRGGLTRVNEGGRGEIMNLPNGTQIIPHDVAKKQQKANNVSVQVTIQGNVIGNRAFMEQTGAYIANKILVAQGVV